MEPVLCWLGQGVAVSPGVLCWRRAEAGRAPRAGLEAGGGHRSSWNRFRQRLVMRVSVSVCLCACDCVYVRVSLCVCESEIVCVCFCVGLSVRVFLERVCDSGYECV